MKPGWSFFGKPSLYVVVCASATDIWFLESSFERKKKISMRCAYDTPLVFLIFFHKSAIRTNTFLVSDDLLLFHPDCPMYVFLAA